MRNPSVSLERLLKPKSVAVVGASRRPGSIGAALLENLIRCGFQGPVYPVNPSTKFVGSVQSYPSVTDLPEPVDLALIAVPRDLVIATAEECGLKGVGALVVITAGFKETGVEGKRLEERLLGVVRKHGMHMVGPNCLGILNTNPEIQLNATFAPTWPPHGSVAMSSQSGALGLAILDHAEQIDLGISTFVSVGNKADVSSNDLISYWERDSETSVILLYLESFGNPKKFTELARRVSHKKPIVAVKSGRTKTGRRAASSHTGAMAGSEAAVEAIFRSAGVIRTDTIDELFDTALLLAHQPLPKSGRVAVLTNAGGPAIMAADAMEGFGLELPALSDKTTKELRSFLPAEASLRNPVDMIASATSENFGRALRALVSDPVIDSVLVIFVPPIVTEARDVAQAIVGCCAESDKPILTCFMGSHGVPEGLRSLQAGRVPSYAFPESAALALSRAIAYEEWRARPVGTIPELTGINYQSARQTIKKLAARKTGPSWMVPADIHSLLDHYGLAQAKSVSVASADEAVRICEELKFPVAVKLISPRYVHKSDVGGVVLNLEDADEVREAVKKIQATLSERGESEAFEGVLVQEMVTGGVEVIVGVTRDDKFGHLIMFGLGGTAVEVLQDVTFNVHPLTDLDARGMLDRLRGSRLLIGYRGSQPADREALADLLLRVSKLVTDFPEIEELDLNPVVALGPGEGVRVLDARILLSASEEPTPILEAT